MHVKPLYFLTRRHLVIPPPFFLVISEENLSEHLLPGLRTLHKEMETVDELIRGKNNYRLMIMELIDQTEEKAPERARKL